MLKTQQKRTAGKPTKRGRTDFGINLLKARKGAGLSQVEVATSLGVDQSTYAKWERHDVALRPSQMKLLLEALKISANELFK